MSTTTAPATHETLQARSSELFRLLLPYRTSALMQRVNLFCVEKTQKKLPEYVNDAEASFEDRIAVVEELLVIAKDQDWDKLPAVPKGQAGQPETKPGAPARPAAAKPKPTAPVEAKPTQPPEPTQPAPVEAAPASNGTAASNGAAAPAQEMVMGHASFTPDSAEPDPMQIIAAQLARLQQPKGKQLAESDVRRVVRQEVATLFTTISEVLRK